VAKKWGNVIFACFNAEGVGLLTTFLSD